MKLSKYQSLKLGERTNPEGKAIRNNILLGLPDSEFRSLRSHLEYCDLPHHLTLQEPTERIRFAYLPNSGMISLVVVTEDGRTVEVGMVGKEGLTGGGVAFGLDRSPIRKVVQIAGNGFRVNRGALLRILKTTPQLQMTLSRYAVLQGIHVAQTAACNRLHPIEQRLARWLLMTQDRIDSGLLPITHDFLATMLGTDRSSVSLAAATMQRKKIIEYKRGSVKVLNRKGLEAAACECYGVIRQFNGALGIK